VLLDQNALEQSKTTPSRWLAFVLSLGLHGGLIALAITLESFFTPDSSRLPNYQVLMLPKQKPGEEKVLWYDFRRAVPEVAPMQPFGPAPTPQGEKDPSRTLIAHAPEAASSKQFIWQPDRPDPIPKDVPTPNLLALPVAPPPPPKPAPKQFVLPAPAPKPEPAQTLLDAPAVAEAPSVAPQENPLLRSLEQQRLATIQKPAPKRFVPPPSPSGPGGPAPLVDAPSIPAQGNSVGDLQAVIVGLNPADRLNNPLPEGSRPGQFARAGVAGTPSSGADTGGDAPKVPGLLARGVPGRPVEAAAANPGNPERRLIKETPFPTLNRTMSAPLRPSSRIIPVTVELLFTNRNVYTLVIPGPDLPDYAGDWVLWFSERQPDIGPSRMSAPVPARKYSWTGADASDVAATGVVQMAAVIDHNGHISAARFLRGSSADAFRRKAVGELEAWEFKPALRNGEPIDVDIVVEIPFQFRPAIQQTR
jgi:TonB family protein